MRVAIIGVRGAVGRELEKLIPSRNFPARELLLFDSKATPDFSEIDLAFFCVDASLAKPLIREAVVKGTTCIDASSAFRKDPSVPLVIPEINGQLLHNHRGIIASPNCTTTILLMALFPLHKKAHIKRIVAATYQAVSGAGAKGIVELKEQSKNVLDDRPAVPSFFPSLCAFNVFPHEAAASEEEKMVFETRKILEAPQLQVSATCIRVPVFRAHSEVLNVEFCHPLSEKEALSLITDFPGIQYQEGATALDASGQNDILLGKVQNDPTQKNTLKFWVVGDQLLKGAALNMIQIAETLCSNSQKQTASGGFSLQ